MVKVAVVYKMPGGTRFIKHERTYGTKYKQNKNTGRMEGRKAVKSYGDKTGIRRVKKDFFLVKGSSGKRGHTRKRYKDGYILGRY